MTTLLQSFMHSYLLHTHSFTCCPVNRSPDRFRAVMQLVITHQYTHRMTASVRPTAYVSVLFFLSPPHPPSLTLCLTLSWQTTEFMWGETRPFHILTALLNTWRHAPLHLSPSLSLTHTQTKNSYRTGRLTDEQSCSKDVPAWNVHYSVSEHLYLN